MRPSGRVFRSKLFDCQRLRPPVRGEEVVAGDGGLAAEGVAGRAVDPPVVGIRQRCADRYLV